MPRCLIVVGLLHRDAKTKTHFPESRGRRDMAMTWHPFRPVACREIVLLVEASTWSLLLPRRVGKSVGNSRPPDSAKCAGKPPPPPFGIAYRHPGMAGGGETTEAGHPRYGPRLGPSRFRVYLWGGWKCALRKFSICDAQRNDTQEFPQPRDHESMCSASTKQSTFVPFFFFFFFFWL